MAQRNPIGLALGGVAAGFLAGMVLPSTRIEDERIGPVSDEIIDRARDAGQEAIERGQQVAYDVADAAGESVQQVADTAKESAREVAGTAKESASSRHAKLDSAVSSDQRRV